MLDRPPLRRRHRGFTRVIRHPLEARVLAVVLAVCTGVVTAGIVSRAESATRAYGDTRRVVVARRELPAGTSITTDDVETRELPAIAVPPGHESDPVGRTTIETVHPGIPILGANLAPDGWHGPAALLPRGHHGVSIPLDLPAPTLGIGDRIDVIGGRPATTVVHAATVIEVSDAAVSLSVGDQDLAPLVQALGDGAVVISLSGPA